MAGRAVGDSVAVDRMHLLGRVAQYLARVAEEDIGVAVRMHRLSPHVAVENAEVISLLVAVTVTVTATATGSGSETAMEVGLGMRGIGVRHFLRENRRLREHRGVTGSGDRGIGDRCLGLGLGRVLHHRGGEGRCVCDVLI